MKLTAPIHVLKRRARHCARTENIPLHAALDRIARQEGFARWSLLAARVSGGVHVREVLRSLAPGDMVAVAARPGHGKTLFCLELAVEAAKAGGRGVFFSLECTPGDVAQRLDAIGVRPDALGGRLRIDLSDGICAAHVMAALADAPRATLAAVDYLQLIDRRRDEPDLTTQLRQLRGFAVRRGVILVFAAQVDRSYDAARRPVPDWGDLRLSGPLDPGLFDKGCFLNGGEMRLRDAA